MNEQQETETICAQLCQFARAQLMAEGASLAADTPLADAGIDSFALVELLLFCERTFGVTVPESHLTRENLASPAALAQCVAALAIQPSHSQSAPVSEAR
jgi:acyl carrier protein